MSIYFLYNFQGASKDACPHAAGVDSREAPPTRGGERQMEELQLSLYLLRKVLSANHWHHLIATFSLLQ